MTRRSKRELADAVDDLTADGEADLRRPLTDREREALADSIDVEAWSATPTSRAVLRALQQAARDAGGEEP